MRLPFKQVARVAVPKEKLVEFFGPNNAVDRLVRGAERGTLNVKKRFAPCAPLRNTPADCADGILLLDGARVTLKACSGALNDWVGLASETRCSCLY